MIDPVPLIDPVSDIIRTVSAAIVDPRFRALRAEEVIEKSPGDLVTVADREAEAALTEAFAGILPGVAVVGEESVSADSSVLNHLAGSDAVWVIDPIDGTKNFVNGSVDHAVMVALVEDDQTIASWIWYPATELMLTACRGAGTAANAKPVEPITRGTTPSEIHGTVKKSVVPDVIRDAMKKRQDGFGSVNRGWGCAGVEYRNIVTGKQDFLLYWEAHPWDHLPGAHLVTELGGRAAHFDGTPYTASSDGAGLLVAATEDTWDTARRQLFG